MAKTYVPLATQTLGSAAASVTFSSIPSTYTDLVLVANIKGVGANGTPKILVNGSAANLSRTTLAGNGTSAASGRYSDNYIAHSAAASTADFGLNCIINIFNYANTTTFKTILTRGNNAAYGTDLVCSLWRSISAITSIDLLLDVTNLAIGSTFTLYGIAAA